MKLKTTTRRIVLIDDWGKLVEDTYGRYIHSNNKKVAKIEEHFT